MMRMSLAGSMDRMTKMNQTVTKKIRWRGFRTKILETDGDEYDTDRMTKTNQRAMKEDLVETLRDKARQMFDF